MNQNSSSVPHRSSDVLVECVANSVHPTFSADWYNGLRDKRGNVWNIGNSKIYQNILDLAS